MNVWCAASTPAEGDALSYGPISEWDTGLITDMNSLFNFKFTCNPPIGAWDTSQVNNIHYIVCGLVESSVYVVYVCMYLYRREMLVDT